MRSDFLPVPATIRSRGRMLSLDIPLVMGILNANADSFYAPSRVSDLAEALEQAERMISEGAAILDIGGASTRPGAGLSDPSEEADRILPLIEAIRMRWPDTWISTDTYHSSVARSALAAGADLVNDISGGAIDPDLQAVTAESGVPYVLMHMRGTPATMAAQTDYQDLIPEMFDYFAVQALRLRELGVSDIIIDPGFGFAKDARQNFILLSQLAYFRHLAYPILIGISRKSFIYKTLHTSPEQALNGSSALHMLALEQGASILRVHDVQAASDVIRLWTELREAREAYQQRTAPQA